MSSGGPPAPWEVVGNTSIRAADGQEMIFSTYWNGKPHGGVNDWTRQRICDGINLLPELVAEIERLQRVERAWHFVQNCPQDEPLRNTLQQAFLRDFKGGAHETKAPQPGEALSSNLVAELLRFGALTVYKEPYISDVLNQAAKEIDRLEKALATALAEVAHYSAYPGQPVETKAPQPGEALSSKERST